MSDKVHISRGRASASEETISYSSTRGSSFHPDGWDTTSAAMGQSFRGPDVALKAARDALARRKAETEGIG